MRFTRLIFILCMLTGPAAHARPDAPCTPVARAFGEEICAEAITAEARHIAAIKEQFEEEGIDSDQALILRSRERLADLIWDKALTARFGADALAATEDEIAAYSAAFRDALAQSHRENIETAARIEALLAQGEQTLADEIRLRNLLATLQTSIAFYQEQQKHKSTMPPEFHTMVKEAENELAAAAIRDWKENKVLYETFGGQLALVGGVLMPAEAMTAFIGYIESEGGLVILDRAYRDIFKDRKRLAAGPHDEIIEPGSPLYRQYFEAPLTEALLPGTPANPPALQPAPQ